MHDCLSRLKLMRRPRLLMRAARIGANDYRREVHLPRLLGYGRLPRYGEALMQLMDIEREINTKRLDDAANYPLLRRVDVMIAIVAEARILQAITPCD